MAYVPRPYQELLIARAREAIRDGHRRVLLVLPTGGGKTVCACEVIRGAIAKEKRILFLAHRRELITQCSASLDENDVDHGVIMAKHWRSRPHNPVQVGSVQTLTSKLRCPDCTGKLTPRVKDPQPVDESSLPKVVDKVQKLVRLSKSSNANEAGNALLAAEALVEKHRLDPSILEVHCEPVEVEPIQVPEPHVESAWCQRCEGTGKISRIKRDKINVDIIFIDEAHRALASSYLEIVQAIPHAVVIGLTATPWRLDGRGLGHMFTKIVMSASMQELVDDGFLAPLRIYAPDTPDLSGVGTSNGDYNTKQLSDVMRDNVLIGSVIDHWNRLGEDRQTIVFASSVEHSQDLVARFVEAGVVAEHLDGTTPKLERDAILKRFAVGETRIVGSVDVLSEGYDLPSLGCVSLCRPTQSLTRFLQQVGRVMRPFDGKPYGILIDHAGCLKEHGLPTDPRNWSLDDRQKRESAGGDPRTLVQCESCKAIRSATVLTCPYCSALQTEIFRVPAETDDQLVEIRPDQMRRCPKCKSTAVRIVIQDDFTVRLTCRSCKHKAYEIDRIAASQASEDRRRKEYRRLVLVARRKGLKPRWIDHEYRRTFGVWPPKAWEPLLALGPPEQEREW